MIPDLCVQAAESHHTISQDIAQQLLLYSHWLQKHTVTMTL